MPAAGTGAIKHEGRNFGAWVFRRYIRTIQWRLVGAKQDAASSTPEGKAGGSPASHFIRRAWLGADGRFEIRAEPSAPRSSKMINCTIGCAFTVHWFCRQTKRDGSSVFASSSWGHASDFWRCPFRNSCTERQLGGYSALNPVSVLSTSFPATPTGNTPYREGCGSIIQKGAP